MGSWIVLSLSLRTPVMFSLAFGRTTLAPAAQKVVGLRATAGVQPCIFCNTLQGLPIDTLPRSEVPLFSLGV